MTNIDTEELWAEAQNLHMELYLARQRETHLKAQLEVTRRLLAKAVGDVEAERKRIIAASDAAFRYINRHK
jgi:hypothetical protein